MGIIFKNISISTYPEITISMPKLTNVQYHLVILCASKYFIIAQVSLQLFQVYTHDVLDYVCRLCFSALDNGI